MEERKRANRTQQKLLVERLLNNLEMARGNKADQLVNDFWVELANDLNTIGCKRDVKQWQHIWTVWVAKTKTKARKVRNSVHIPGESVTPYLTTMEKKILHIIGKASIRKLEDQKSSFDRSRMPPNTSPQSFSSEDLAIDLSPALDVHGASDPIKVEQTLQSELKVKPKSGQARRRLLLRRRRLPLLPDLGGSSRQEDITYDSFLQAFQESNNMLGETIRQSAQDIADALRGSSAATLRAAEILAAALTSGISESR